MELFEAIRRDARREEVSIRGLADRYGVHRRTVRQALAAAEPPGRKVASRPAPRLDPARELIDAMLREDLDAPRKQRHTARRVRDRLVDEHGLAGITYSTVRDYVHVRRPQIWAEAGRPLQEVYIAQLHEPGAQAEVDFADLWVVWNGEKVKLFLFTLRLSYSGRAVHRVFNTQCQEAFLEGHVYAFEQLGGVPTGQIRYDNLKSAVSRVLFGRSRVESERWVAFRSHYGFDPFYCRPGQEGAHEKGGVENEGGRFRRTHLVPVPVIGSVAELNARLAAADAADDARRIEHRTNTVGTDFAVEQAVLRALPGERFETGITLTPRVDRHARVGVRQCRYSVPARLIGGRVRVLLRAEEVLAFDGRLLVARHERARTRGEQVLDLDHYLEVLVDKPGALPGSMALAQARAAKVFTPAHEAFWAAARAARGDGDGTRALIEVLLLHRQLPAAAVVAGIRAALTVGAANPDLVAVEARRAATGTGRGDGPDADGRDAGGRHEVEPDDVDPDGARVIDLPVRTSAGDQTQQAALSTALPGERPLPSVAHYDELLARRTSHHPTG